MITGIILDDPGSGYATAPNVVIRDGTQFDPIILGAARASAARTQSMQSQAAGKVSSNAAVTPNAGAGATATATINIHSISMDTFGAGYTATPTVSITDQTGTGSGASATAVAEVGGVTAVNLTNPGSGYVTPGGIKKFTDALPGLCNPASGGCPTSGKYIPVGVADTASYANSDTYEIGLVQYRTSFSSSLPPTLVRGYVQLETPANAAVSQHFPLYNEMLNGTQVPVMMSDGVTQWLAVTPPQYLGPVIAATKDKPVRIIFHNLLPTGSGGDLFLPTDSTLMGSGMGPMGMPDPVDQGTVIDAVRNPMCSEYPKSDMCFKDNRATLHLHGGITPWISDGTPHQWITPANEMTAWPQGVSVENVPDMNVCAPADDGCQTFYYTNQQSARLMFYHDHAWGITRLNVYAGEAAGYLISDPTEQKLITNGTIPADQIPLVIQDRTFVPQASQLAAQDPTWDTTRWGGYGNFWYHHVYMPAQNPGDPGGMSAYGRWMYGPWFWPPATPMYGPIANPYYNMDPATNFTTPLAKPCNLDDPTTWQYQTDPFCEPELIPGTPNVSVGMEQFNDTPIVNGTAYPTITLEPKSYRLRILNAANDRFFNFQWYVGDANTASTGLNSNGQVIGATEVALNPAELAAAQTDPIVSPTPVQSTATAGPDWIQIGTEGGFLPAPTVVDGQQPTTWITDPTRFDVGNVDKHSLLLAPAERADVIVDFSKFAGKTLILYNDAPAAFPARVASYDYYTGAPDLSPVGAPTILPGYGPNTRTIMQVKIAANAAAPAFNLSALNKAFSHKADGSGVFESGQNPIIVGQSAYNSAYGTSFVSSNWCNAPGSTSTQCDGFVRVSDTSSFSFNTLKAPTAKMSMNLQPKAIHDEMNSTTFDEFGRMQANLGIEAQPPTPGLQNVTLYPYVNPQTELIDATNLPKGDINVTAISSAADGTQIWRITHNGVDTHPIHWHLYDVQVLNRVTWDNIILPPEASELGWKDTLRISPLEDTIVALRPIIPSLPFELPNSVRPLNPMMPLGSTVMFNNIDPQGNPTAPVVNQLVNFGWEYVYHCHILSHEEMDMMRPVTVALPPTAADGLVFNKNTATLTWNDNSINETAFLVQRSTDGGTTWTDVGNSLSPLDQPNALGTRSMIDPTFSPTGSYKYRVVAKNTVGYGAEFPTLTVQSISAQLDVAGLPAAPTNLTAALQAGPQVRLTWTDNANNETGFIIERAIGAGAFAQIGTVGANTTTYVDTTVQAGTTYRYRVAAVNVAGNSPYSNTVQVFVPAPPAAPTNLVAVVQTGPVRVQLTWRDNATNETGFVIERSVNGGAFATLATVGPRAGTGNVTYTDNAVAGGSTYAYRVAAVNNGLMSAYSNTATASLAVPAAPSNVNVTGVRITNNADRVVVVWVDNSNNETSFTIQRSTSSTFPNNATTVSYTVAANSNTFTTPNLPRNVTLYFRIQAVNGFGASAWVNASPFPITTP
jgi:FtsP/CotA-like multicopper oxidase with cupredoxin domain